MRHYGIIGFPLDHSFSAKYFNEKFATECIEAEYSLYPVKELTDERMNGLQDSLDGFNVTFPYKQTVIPYLERLDETARAIGAVNVIYKRVGYNTDCAGFMASIQPLLHDSDKKALVLGTGGAAKAVCYGLQALGISPTMVSRTPAEKQSGYDTLDRQAMEAHTIIVNCTPLGMYPDITSCPDIPYQWISAQHLLYDCVYNPEETLFLKKGREQGARTKNGMEMLMRQAQAAWKIWAGEM